MIVNFQNNFINFNGRQYFKQMFDRCAYTGKVFTRNNPRSVEHIVPHSFEGSLNHVSNYLIVAKSINSQRGNMPLDEFLRQHPSFEKNIVETVKSKHGIVVEGIVWADEVRKTLAKVLGRDIFT
ncbi:MAG: hypothetical protein PHX18_07645 [Candidatus Gastranaerophilales bacterium]|nr:hypothetical protein [Candidatus Gastranaerophilales bacterium]